MNKAKLWVTALIVSALLIGILGVFRFSLKPSHFVPFPKPHQPLYSVLRNDLLALWMPASDWTLQVYGTTGTAVVVGYELDRSQTGILRGVIPTKFTFHFRHRLYYAIKNVGTNTAHLGFQPDDGNMVSVGSIFPSFFGFSGQMERFPGGESSQGGSTLNPRDWPETLPPGMSEAEARRHDFARELDEARLHEFQSLLAKDPGNQHLLLGLAWEFERLKKHGVAMEVYEKFFATDCSVFPMELNNAVYFYVDKGGTNLNRAYQLALKAQEAMPLDLAIEDTVGWILFKQGDYEQALGLLKTCASRSHGNNDSVILFHLGMTHYMLAEENLARDAFQKVVQDKEELPEKEEAKKCLQILDMKGHTPEPTLVAKLKARLAEMPDDSLALSRLAGLYEQGGNAQNDPLVAKAQGWMAYRRAEYSRAVQYLTESAKERPSDAQLFFLLGMSCDQVGQKSECADWLHKALALNLKIAQADQANRVLASLPSK